MTPSYLGELGYYTHYQEPEFGLLQLGVRYYEPETGRFTQRDRVFDELSIFAYVAGNPVTYVDPLGLKPISKMICRELTDAIERAYGEVKKHWEMLREDPRGLYSRPLIACCNLSMIAMARTREGAEEDYKNWQKNLRNHLQEWVAKQCYKHHSYRSHVPEDAWKVATNPVPKPKLRMDCKWIPIIVWPQPVPFPAPVPSPIPVPVFP